MDLTLNKKLQVYPKGAGNIKYRDIENGEIEKTGTSKKSWELKFRMPQYQSSGTSKKPQWRFVENYKKCLITGFLRTKKNTSLSVV